MAEHASDADRLADLTEKLTAIGVETAELEERWMELAQD